MKKVFKSIYLIFKRIMDFLFAAILLIILLIPFLIVAIAIKIDDGGKVFYKQIRIGKNLKPFKIYKYLYCDIPHEMPSCFIVSDFAKATFV